MKKVLFFGSGALGKDVLKALSDKASVSVVTVKREEEILELLETIKPDFAVVAGWRWLLPKEVVNLPMGAIACHHSLLPYGRGFAPVTWTLLNEDKFAGTTWFYLSKGVDEGKVIAQAKASVMHGECYSTLRASLNQLALNEFNSFINDFLKGKQLGKPQSGKPFYFGKRIPRDSRINWLLPAKEIELLIRSVPLDAKCFFNDGENKVFVLKAVKPVDVDCCGVAGQVVAFIGKNALVKCGEGALLLKTLQVGDREDADCVFDACDLLRVNVRLT